MKFNPPKCPECGQTPSAIVEVVPVVTGLYFADPNGEAEFDSERLSEVVWDEAKPEALDGVVTVYRKSHHSWFTVMN